MFSRSRSHISYLIFSFLRVMKKQFFKIQNCKPLVTAFRRIIIVWRNYNFNSYDLRVKLLLIQLLRVCHFQK